MFVFSSKDFNQAYKRLKYLEQYNAFRRKQAMEIQAAQDQLTKTLLELENAKKEKESLIDDTKQEAQLLSLEKNVQNKIFTTLKQKEDELKKKLEQQKLADEKLLAAINAIIAEEAKLSAERNKTKNPKSTTNVFELTPEEKLISDKFEANQGRLPWPTETGVITDSYGEHEHPVLKGIKVKNDGVTISTSTGAYARSIFDGEVSRVISIPGKNKAVIIRHGEYLTVYANLIYVVVNKGDKVKAKQTIGTVFTDQDEDNKTTVDIQIWKGTTKLNPELWLTHK
jgi:septal ring factor EnvC (AmiA/AmiB activator)